MTLQDLSREELLCLKMAYLMQEPNSEITYEEITNIDSLVTDEQAAKRFMGTPLLPEDFSMPAPAEKSTAQELRENFARIKSFAERQVGKAHQKFVDIMTHPTRLDALADHAKFCFQFGHPYCWFLQSFKPANETEKAQFSNMMRRMKASAHPQLDYNTLAKIGDMYVLRAIWHEHEHKDPMLCALVAANRNCPDDILREALYHRNYEIRKAAVLNPELLEKACIRLAREELNPFVIEALRDRLGHRYPEAWELDNTPSVTNNRASRTALDSIIGNAAHRAAGEGTGAHNMLLDVQKPSPDKSR